MFYQTGVDKAVLVVFENRTNGADLAIVSNDAVVIRKRALDVADRALIVNQLILTVHVHIDVVDALAVAVFYPFGPLRDVDCRRRKR